MTLSLDDVRSKRFRLARKSGYEVAEVDDFLDAVQESFAQLVEENDNLKKQIDAFGDEQPAATDRVATDGAPADSSSSCSRRSAGAARTCSSRMS